MSAEIQARSINDDHYINTVCLLAVMLMNAVGRVSAIMVSRCRGEAFHHLKIRLSLLSVTLSEVLKLLHDIPDAACSLAAGARVVVILCNHLL